MREGRGDRGSRYIDQRISIQRNGEDGQGGGWGCCKTRKGEEGRDAAGGPCTRGTTTERWAGRLGLGTRLTGVDDQRQGTPLDQQRRRKEPAREGGRLVGGDVRAT